MKRNKLKLITTISLAYILMTVFLIACKKDNGTTNFGINPKSQATMTNKALNINGKLIEGKMPTSNNTNGGIAIVKYPSAVQVSAGVDLYIPIQVSDTICFIYLQVEGADSYWKINPEVNYTTNTAILKVFVPNFVLNGNFNFNYSIADCKGNVSSYVTTNTLLTAPLQCDNSISGSYGITITHFDLGDNPGIVKINYDMYSIPDRLDLKYNNQWIASTGTLLGSATGPDYNLSTGFVSNSGQLSFNYNPSQGHDLYVYVTGKDQGTAWDVTVNCAE